MRLMSYICQGSLCTKMHLVKPCNIKILCLAVVQVQFVYATVVVIKGRSPKV